MKNKHLYIKKSRGIEKEEKVLAKPVKITPYKEID